MSSSLRWEKISTREHLMGNVACWLWYCKKSKRGNKLQLPYREGKIQLNYSPLPSGHGLGHQIQDRPLELCRIFRATPGGAGSLFKSAEPGQRVWPGHHPHAHPAGRGTSLLSSQLSSLSGWAPPSDFWVQLPGTLSSKERSVLPCHCTLPTAGC